MPETTELAVRDLAELDLASRAEFGGKAAHLGHAARLGCPVLPGVAISTRLFMRFVEQGGLLGEVSSILSTMQPRTMAQFQAAAWAIHAAFQVRRLPNEVRDALVTVWAQLDAPLVAVRSSATNEDSATRSFIGQHASTLNVNSAEALIAAALESWVSLFSAKSLAYAQRFGVDLLSARMGLIVQPMITPTAQGALFTVDPITGDPDRFVLEIHQGAEQGVFDLDPYGRKPGEHSYWSQLRYYGLLLDEHDLAYQAIEWAISGEALFFLRVRPATAVPRFLPAKERDAMERGSGLAHPLRLADHGSASRRALAPCSRYYLSRMGLGASGSHRNGSPPDDLLERLQVCGYLYRRASAAEAELKVDASGLALLSQSLRSMVAVGRADQADAAQVSLLRAELDRLCQAALSDLAGRELAEMLSNAQRIGDNLVGHCVRLNQTTGGLLDALDQMHRQWAHSEVDAALLAHAGEAQPSTTRRQAGEAPDPQNIEELVSFDILSGPRPNPGAAARADSKPQPTADGGSEQAVIERRLLASLGLVQRPLYEALLGRTRQLQERLGETFAAAVSARHLERATVLEAGRRLRAAGSAASEQDTALLEAREIERWLLGEAPDEATMRWVMQRREVQRRAWRYAPPDELTTAPTAAADLDDCDLVLKGRAVSSGIAVGRARVIRSLGETSAVLPGEILVCATATFELSPLFGTVAALVAETGTLLDHGSVLVREYGLPGIVAVAGVLEQLKTGDELVVDARRGLVGRRRATPRPSRFVLDEL